MSEEFKSPILVTGTLVPSGTQDVNVVSPNPLPVSGTFTPSGTQDANITGQTITLAISAASLPLPTGASTEATLLAAKIDLDKFTFTATRLLIDGSGVVQPISGSVNVSNFPSTTAVTQNTSPWIVNGSGFTQPISGTVAISGTVPISGTVTANLGTVDGVALDATLTNGTQQTQITNFPATQNVAVTSSVEIEIKNDTGNPIPVTGPLTDAQLRATSVPVTGTFFQSTQPVSGVGNFTIVQATGTNLHTTVDNFPATQPISGTVAVSNFPVTQAVTQSTSPWIVSLASTTITGTVAVTQSTSPWVNNITQLGGTAIDTNSGIKSAGTQRIVIATDQPQLTNALKVDGSAVTQPISGTVTAVQSTGANLHAVLDASSAVIGHVIADSGSTTTVTGNVTIIQPTGTNLHTVLDSGTLTSITNPLPSGSNVIGHVIADSGSTTAVTGNVTVVQATGTNLHTVVDSGSITVNNASGASAVNIQDGGNSLTVDNNGTFLVQAAQSGTWTVQPGNTPNTSPWLFEQRAPGTLATYSASTLGLTAAATPTDIFTIYGSGTKTVKIIRIEISASENSAAIRDLVLIKRSATNTGGTSAAVTAVPHDSNNAGAMATVLSYTANPAALGASVGIIRTVKIDIPATNLVGNADRITWTFADRPGQPIVLRGTNQGVALNLNGVTSASNSFDINIEWTEE